MKRQRVPGLQFSAAIYGFFLRILPSGFRGTYGNEMRWLFHEMYVAAYQSRGFVGSVRFATQALFSVVSGAAGERQGQPDEKQASTGPSGPHRPGRASSRARAIDRIRAAARSARRSPGFSLTVILLLGLGIGATTTIYSVVNGTLLRPLPYPDQDRLVYVSEGSHSTLYVKDLRSQVDAFESVVGGWARTLNLTGGDSPRRILVGYVTDGFFSHFGWTQPALGRLLTQDDFTGPRLVGVLSFATWQEEFGGSLSVLGQMMTIEGESYEIVGVFPQEVQPPEAMMSRGVELWTPFDLNDPAFDDRGWSILEVSGKLAPNASIEVAGAQVDRLVTLLSEEYPNHRTGDGDPRFTPLETLYQATIGGVGNTLYLLLGAVGVLLLIACVNVANLFLARSSGRVRETSLRGVLGASRAVVISELVAESLLLALLGGVVGVALSFGGVEVFKALDPGGIPRSGLVSVDVWVLLFGLLAALATGVLFSIIPAVHAFGAKESDSLRGGSSGGGRSRGFARFQSGLVVGELALSLILLTGAGLLFHSFIQILSVDPGFDPDGLVRVELELPPSYDAAGRVVFANTLMQELEAIPGVQSSAVGFSSPFQFNGRSRCCWSRTITPPDRPDEDIRMFIQPVSDRYFETLDTKIVAGRSLQEGDTELRPVPAVLSTVAAEALSPDRDIIGREFSFGSGEEDVLRVVGVVEGLRHWGLQEEVDREVYLPYDSYGGILEMMTFLVRTETDPITYLDQARAAVWRVDGNLPIGDLATMNSQVSSSLNQERFLLTLLTTFAVLALILASAGVYSTFAYSVRQKNREMGLRVAIGASAHQIQWFVLERGFKLTLMGLILGIAGSIWLSRFLEGMVFGISVTDLATFSTVAAILASVGLAACYVPAVRASRADPLEALRAE